MSTSQQGEDQLGQLLNSVVTAASDAVLITEAGSIEEADGGPRIVYANEAFERMTGYTRAEVIGRTPRLLQCEETDPRDLRAIRRALKRWEPIEMELRNRRKDGRRFWVEISITPAYDGGRCTHWVSIQRDVTARRERQERDEQRLQAARERLRGAFGHAPIGMAVTAPDGTLLEVNPSLAALLERDAEDLVGGTLFDVTHPDDLAGAERACRELGEHGGDSRHECRLLTVDDRALDVVVHSSLVLDAAGNADHVIMHVEDVSERNALERELSRRALSDPLTQLPNRVMLLDRLAQAIARRNRDGSSLALLFVDVDGFKRINDEHGHAAGDEVIAAIGHQLSGALRPGDTVSRLGGDEFVVLCEHTTGDEAEAVADRLRGALPRQPLVGAGASAVSVSIGVAVASGREHTEPEALLAHADTAMYEAKRRGGDRRVTYDLAMSERAGHQRTTERELRAAIERDELCLHYQPLLRLEDRSLHGVEALVRWNHPERGLLLPGEFIPAAERGGFVDALGSWVTAAACRYASVHRRPPVVWINVSAGQLGDGYVHEIARCLHERGLEPGRLGIELTETVLLDDLQSAREQLGELRRLGIPIAIDDFGTGYSSLAYLAELPVSAVKIDRSFTARLGRGERGRLVISAVMGMASALGLEVVAEGVETEAQVTSLRELGVVYAQGFHLGRPRP